MAAHAPLCFASVRHNTTTTYSQNLPKQTSCTAHKFTTEKNAKGLLQSQRNRHGNLPPSTQPFYLRALPVAVSHAPKTCSAISFTPTPCFTCTAHKLNISLHRTVQRREADFHTCVKTNGPPSLISRESRSMTPRSAPTASARSVLLITCHQPQQACHSCTAQQAERREGTKRYA